MLTRFNWDRNRLFDRKSCVLLFEGCVEPPAEGRCTVVGSDARPTRRKRPCPLNTVELQKRVSRFLRISSERTMLIAEGLYTRGILSYPRTETDYFKDGFELLPLIEEQQGHQQWGAYARTLLNDGKFLWPSPGGHDDQAHPPIHPLKMLHEQDCQDRDEWGVYVIEYSLIFVWFRLICVLIAALQSLSLLLSYLTTTLASHVSIILIKTILSTHLTSGTSS